MSSVEWVSGQPINDALFGRRLCDEMVATVTVILKWWDDDGCDSNSSGGPAVVVTVMV